MPNCPTCGCPVRIEAYTANARDAYTGNLSRRYVPDAVAVEDLEGLRDELESLTVDQVAERFTLMIDQARGRG